MNLSDRALNLKPSPTLALAARAKKMVAEGRPVISLSVGEPDWPTFSEAILSGVGAIKEGQTKYAPASGLMSLRSTIAEIEGASLGLKYAPEEVTVSTGAKFILFSAFQCLLNQGDEVLIPAPYWVSYPDMIELAGGVPKIVQSSADQNFKLTPELLKSVVTSKTKMLLLNSPSNPTGSVYSKAELAALAEVIRPFPDLVVISDDIYNRLIFSGETIAPHLLQVAPDLKSQVIVVNGVSKSYAMTGWRVGWAMGPQNVIAAMSNYQSQSVSCAAPFAQIAAEEVLKNGASSLQNSVGLLKERRDFAASAISKIKGLDLISPDGAFYLWTGIEKLIGLDHQGEVIRDSKAFAELLLEKAEVAVVPGQEFGQDGFVRMSYALDSEKMGQAFDRISNFIGSLSGS